MTAPTEAEIREAIRIRLTAYPMDNPRDDLYKVAGDVATLLYGPSSDVLNDEPAAEDGIRHAPQDVWSDLRLSEARAMGAIYRSVCDEAADAALAVITDMVVTAALRFAAAYPEAGRALPEPVAA